MKLGLTVHETKPQSALLPVSLFHLLNAQQTIPKKLLQHGAVLPESYLHLLPSPELCTAGGLCQQRSCCG